jgi:hypothetical protein
LAVVVVVVETMSLPILPVLAVIVYGVVVVVVVRALALLELLAEAVITEETEAMEVTTLIQPRVVLHLEVVVAAPKMEHPEPAVMEK